MRKPKLLIISPYPVSPSVTGGKIRITAVAAGLTEGGLDVTVLTPFTFGQRRAFERENWPFRLKQIPYPFLWALLTDRPLPFQILTSFHPGLGKMLKKQLKNYDIVQFEHVQFSSLLSLVPPSTKVVYDAHNVEYDYVRGELASVNQLLRKPLANRVYNCERRLVEGADQVLVVSQRDAERFQELYGLPTTSTLLVPNGMRDESPVGSEERLIRRIPELEHMSRVLVFSGSNVAHNRDAVEQLLTHLAPGLGNDSALILHGQITRAFQAGELPPMVYLDPDGAFEDYAEVQAIGLNPVRIGSGTNLKLLHYLSFGMRVVTTSFGLRGLESLARHVRVADVEDFGEALRLPFPEPPCLLSLRTDWTWKRITEKLMGYYLQKIQERDIPETQSEPMELTEHLDTCPLCEASNINERQTQRLSQCQVCKLHFYNPRPDQKTIVDSYDSGQTYSLWQEERQRRAPLWQKRLNLILRFQTRGRLLDIGTGDGHFLEFASRSFDVASTEVSKPGAAYCRQRGCHPRLGDLEQLDFQPESFDVVTLWHVLEHLPNPGRSLRKLVSILKPGGLVFIAVPNESLPLAVANLPRWGRGPVFLLKSGHEIHLSYFTPSVLKTTVENLGLEILEFGVDDVHVDRSWSVELVHQANQILNSLLSWHLGKAMFVVARKPHQS